MFRIAILLTLSLPLIASAQSLPATLVARNGQTVPGAASATFSTIGPLPRLGVNGHVAINATIAGGGATTFDDFGYWVGTPGNLQLAVREDTANSGPEQFPGNANVGVDADGNISVWFRLAFPHPANENEFLRTYLPNGSMAGTLVAQESNTVAPGFAGGLFVAIGSGAASNDAGALAFTGSVTGGDVTGATNDFGLFAGTPGDLKLVAREGAAAPGATGTAPVFSTTTTTIYDKRINNSGQVGFSASLSGAGVDFNNDQAIYIWTPNGGNGTLDKAVQTGDNAPGTSPTINFRVLGDRPDFNDAGQVAFRGALVSNVPGELNLVNDTGIWAGAPGNLQLIMRSDANSPIAGLKYRSPEVNGSPRLNNAGDVVFVSLVTGPGVTLANDRVLWRASSTGTEVVAREGDPAAGTEAGVNFNTLDGIGIINNAGQVVFGSTLTGTGVVPANDRGLWGGTPGNLFLIAREGDVIDVDPGPDEVLKTISGNAGISFANGFGGTTQESASAAFNDAGQIAWRALFTDSTTAVFLTTLPALPGDDLDGDYNDDGIVDAADYVVWRKLEGTSTDLPNDPNPLPIDNDQYNTWTANFGNSVGGGGLSTPVPEPAGLALLAIAIATSRLSPRRRPG